MLTKIATQRALSSMQEAHAAIVETMAAFDIDITNDLRLRNVMMSTFHEHFFGRNIPGATVSGRTGEPDILIPDTGVEIECKLTSPTGKQKSVQLQTDWRTLVDKGSLNYLYVIADTEFEKFAVLYFEGLTSSDFHPPARGSRGRAKMKKAEALDKCHVLHGAVVNQAEKHVEKLKHQLRDEHNSCKRERLERKLEYWQTASRVSFQLAPVP